MSFRHRSMTGGELNVRDDAVSSFDNYAQYTTTRKIDMKKKYISARNSMSYDTNTSNVQGGGVGSCTTDDSLSTTKNDIHKTFDRVIPSDSMELLLLEHHNMDHIRYHENDNNRPTTSHNNSTLIKTITTTITSPSNIPRNILMLDSPTLSDFHHHHDDDIMIASQPKHLSYERIESKDSSSSSDDVRGMTPIPFADIDDNHTQQDEVNPKLPFITLHDHINVKVPLANNEMLLFPDDDISSHSYSSTSSGYNTAPYYKTRYENGRYSYPRQPTTSSNNNLHRYHHDSIPYNYNNNNFHHDFAAPSSQYSYNHHNMIQHQHNYNYSHLYYYGHNNINNTNSMHYNSNNPWINNNNPVLTSGSVAKGTDHIPSKQQQQQNRVVPQRSINMIVGDVLLNSNNDDYYNNKHSNPRYVIRVSYKAFVHIKYQLPCLRTLEKEKDVCPVNISSIHGSIRHYTTTKNRSTTTTNSKNNNIEIRKNETELSNDIKIAIRRVESAIRFFGGCPYTCQSPLDTNNDTNKNQTRTSIFRLSSSNHNDQCEQQQQLIDDRYNTDGNRLPWDVETQTPNDMRCSKPEERDSNDDLVISYEEKSKSDLNIERINVHENIIAKNDHRTVHPEKRFQTLPLNRRTSSDEGVSSIESDEDSYLKAKKYHNNHQVNNSSKGKYLCKLCGKPKQNHRCPYEIRLQRSIGIMVYNAINAYSAAEPGKLAPALTDMNNFVSYDTNDQDHTSTMQLSPTLGGYISVGQQAFQTVTPEQKLRNEGCNDPMQSKEMFDSPHNHSLPAPTIDNDENIKRQSSLSLLRGQPLLIPQVGRVSNGTTLSSVIQVAGMKRNHTKFQESQRPWKGEHPEECQARTKKDESSYSQLKNKTQDTTTSKFVDSVILRPEHFRSVTRDEQENDKGSGSYEYDPVPLPKCERQRLCDTLFHLITHEIPDMRDECLQVLHEVQQQEMLLLSNDNQDIDDNRTGCEWDLAIAELLAQILVGLHCTDDDLQLDGLAKYLMSVGIAC